MVRPPHPSAWQLRLHSPSFQPRWVLSTGIRTMRRGSGLLPGAHRLKVFQVIHRLSPWFLPVQLALVSLLEGMDAG